MPIDLSNIKTTRNRGYNTDDIEEINDSLYYLPDKQRASVLATIIEESGGNPLKKSKNGTYQGLLQWESDRYKIKSGNRREELKNQLQYLKNTIYNTTDKKSWTHGGKGSGYNSLAEPFTKFHSTGLPLDSVYRGFSYGYVKPEGKEESYQNRLKVAKQVLDRYPKIPDYLSTPGLFDKIKFENMGVSAPKAEGGSIETSKRKLWHKLSQAEKSEMMKVAVRNGITNLQEIRKKYNEFAEGGNIYDGTTMNSRQTQTAVSDATYVNIPVAPVYSSAYQLPEVTVKPDSDLSPAERVLAERARKQAHDKAFGKGSYDAYRRREQTNYLIDKAARPTNVDRALDYAASLVSGIGQGADITSMTMGGLPVYSALKGAKALSEKDYVDGAMWLAPMLGVTGKKIYNTAKPVAQKIFQKQIPATQWAEINQNQPKFLNFGNVDDGLFRFNGFKENPIQMHLKRAQAKGYDISDIKIYDLSKNNSENNIFIKNLAQQYKLSPEDMKVELLSYLDETGHAGNIKGTKIIVHDGKANNLDAIISHEIDHALHYPSTPIPEEAYHPRLFNSYGDYFSRSNNTEIAARGSQLHDYFGHVGTEPITEDMLEYAKHHYIRDTGLNNDMHDFLWTIRNPKKVAAWLTDNSTALAFPVTMTISSKPDISKNTE